MATTLTLPDGRKARTATQKPYVVVSGHTRAPSFATAQAAWDGTGRAPEWRDVTPHVIQNFTDLSAAFDMVANLAAQGVPSVYVFDTHTGEHIPARPITMADVEHRTNMIRDRIAQRWDTEAAAGMRVDLLRDVLAYLATGEPAAKFGVDYATALADSASAAAALHIEW
jgi:hypothetical protein